MNLRDHPHCLPGDAGSCPQCGQPLPATQLPLHVYGANRVNPAGLAVTVLFHVLLLAVFLLRPDVKTKPPAPTRIDITYVVPVPPKPKPPPPKFRPNPGEPARVAPSQAAMARLPNTISLPAEQAAPPPEPEQPAVVKIDPAQDMAAMIEARRRARGQAEQPAEESEAERGNRIARANVDAANGRAHGTGSRTWAVLDKSFSMAVVQVDMAVPGQRSRLVQVRVELGDERDIETAIIKAMVQIFQARANKDIAWVEENPPRTIRLSGRKSDTAELTDFLMKNFFPDYRPPAGQYTPASGRRPLPSLNFA